MFTNFVDKSLGNSLYYRHNNSVTQEIVAIPFGHVKNILLWIAKQP